MPGQTGPQNAFFFATFSFVDKSIFDQFWNECSLVDFEVFAVNKFEYVVRNVEVNDSLGDLLLCQETGPTETNVNKLLPEERYQLAGGKERSNK